MFRSITVILAGAFLVACAGPAEQAVKAQKKVLDAQIEAQLTDQPEWFLNPPQSDDLIYGTGTSGLNNLAAALQQAKLGAMREITGVISSTVSSKLDDTVIAANIEQNTFRSAGEAISRARLVGVEVLKRQTVRTEVGIQTYVLAALPKENAAKFASEKVKQNLDEAQLEEHKSLLNELDEAIRKRL
jgi:hypothetical protein